MTLTYIITYRYVLTCIDRTTRQREAKPISQITAQSLCKCMDRVVGHSSARYNRTRESIRNLVFWVFVGYVQLPITLNSLVERAHRTIKTAIVAQKESLLSALSIVLLGIRSSMPNSFECSPLYAVTCTEILIPLLLIDNTNNETVI